MDARDEPDASDFKIPFIRCIHVQYKIKKKRQESQSLPLGIAISTSVPEWGTRPATDEETRNMMVLHNTAMHFVGLAVGLAYGNVEFFVRDGRFQDAYEHITFRVA